MALNNAKIDNSQKIILCTNPRSGSTYLSRLLVQHGNISGCQEFFEGSHIEEEAMSRLNIASTHTIYQDPLDYLDRVIDSYKGTERYFCLVLHAYQWRYWKLRGFDIFKHFNADKAILLERKDSDLQAQSYMIAHSTGQFVSDQSQDHEPTYNFRKMLHSEFFVKHGMICWKRLLQRANMETIKVCYEDLDLNRNKELSRIFDFLDLDAETTEMIEPTAKLRTSLNYSWAERYKAEKALWRNFPIISYFKFRNWLRKWTIYEWILLNLRRPI